MSDSIAHENLVSIVQPEPNAKVLTDYQNRYTNNVPVAQCTKARREGRDAGRSPTQVNADAVLTASAQRAGAQQCIPHESRMSRARRGGGGGAAPSVATAGRPRLERRYSVRAAA